MKSLSLVVPALSAAWMRAVLRSLFCAALIVPGSALAASFDGSTLGLVWGIPFAGILLSIAFLPLFMPIFWHHHFGKIALGWAVLLLVPFIASFGLDIGVQEVAHAMLLEYIPFIILLTALYTVAGGIYVLGNLHGSPGLNTGLLAIGTGLASIMGTTGAAMLMIRPLIRANDNRTHKVHTIIFFIFLVANAGGALTPLGDPPLFLGFLKGVDFFWTVRVMWAPTLFICASLLGTFYLIDRYYYHKAGEEAPPEMDPTPDDPRIRIIGKINFVLLGGIIAAVLMSGLWKPGVQFQLLGNTLELQNVVRDVLLVGIALLSLTITPRAAREGNEFNWAPIKEVAKLFFGIFVTIIPVIAMLRAGDDGAFRALVQLVTNPDGSANNAMYFWLTGLLSGFLDNAPTYLVFFNLAGGDPVALMRGVFTLEAISAGAVFMGALTYIGNAPNFMVKAMAEDRGIRMPSFFGYMLWSCLVLLPLFVVMTWIFFV